jgi:phage FluMu protein Com
MKTELVRCWKVGPYGGLFITYPEGDLGHRLICCKSCGKVYAVNVTKQLYIEPDLDIQLKSLRCASCAKLLGNNWLSYPENYIDSDGSLRTYVRPMEMPLDVDSQIVAFPEVYS